MGKVTRHVFFQLLGVFLITLAGITLLLIFVGVIKEGIREGLGVSSIARMLPYVVPVALQPSLPATILLAACSVYGRMAADNEIVAVKSLGISPMALIRPALILGFIVSLFGVWINDIAPSWGRIGIYRVAIESVEEIMYRMLETQNSYSSQGLSINVRDVDDRVLINPHIMIQAKGDSPKVSIVARKAELVSDQGNEVLTILLTDGFVTIGDEIEADFTNSTYRQIIPLPSLSRRGDTASSPSLVPLRNIESVTADQTKLTAGAERVAATQAAYQLMVGDFAALADAEQWRPRQQQVEGNRNRLHRLRLEPYRRWATGFSCFFFVLVGAPLAIRMRTRNFFTTFAACFFPILLAYYPLLAFAIDRAKDGAVPPYTVWLGNLVMLIAGAILLRRVIRY